MYHRYMQNENGQFRRERVPEAPGPCPPPARTEPPKPRQAPRTCGTAPRMPSVQGLFAGRDQGDLLVLLILLLLLEEGSEESSTVVMTLAIFLLLQ